MALRGPLGPPWVPWDQRPGPGHTTWYSTWSSPCSSPWSSPWSSLWSSTRGPLGPPLGSLYSFWTAVFCRSLGPLVPLGGLWTGVPWAPGLLGRPLKWLSVGPLGPLGPLGTSAQDQGTLPGTVPGPVPVPVPGPVPGRVSGPVPGPVPGPCGRAAAGRAVAPSPTPLLFTQKSEIAIPLAAGIKIAGPIYLLFCGRQRCALRCEFFSLAGFGAHLFHAGCPGFQESSLG